MSRRLQSGDAERDPLIAGEQLYLPALTTSDSDGDEGEVIFDGTAHPGHDEKGTAQRRLTFEEAVEESGFGVFHWLLLVACGWANASDAVEIMCVSFLLPTARCDLRLSSSDMGVLTASIFLGMMVGGYVWGYLADQRGRRKVLVVSLTVNGLFGGLSSLAPRFWSFLILRFISGVGVGGSIPVIFSYFSEFLPRLRRGAMISALATFWMAGNILAAGLAWLVIPRTWAHIPLGGFDFQSWRLFVALCSVPSLTSALLFRFLLPESPKYLMEADREKEAVHVFQTMFEVNHWGRDVNHKGLLRFGLCTSSTRRGVAGEPASWGLVRLCKKGLAPIRQLYSGALRSRSIALIIVFYCISFGYYGLWMWFPELFKRAEDGGSPCGHFTHSFHGIPRSCH